MIKFLLLLVLLCSSLNVWADRGGVIFYSSFDGKPDADYAVGSPRAELNNVAAKFLAGHRGEAMRSGDGEALVAYEVAKNLLADEGTIEFWICPQDWDGFDGARHQFFQALGTGGLQVYKDATEPEKQGSLTFAVSRSADNWRPLQQWPAFKRSTWMHIIVTWNRREYMVYPNAFYNFAPHPNPALPENLAGRFAIGDVAPGASRNAHSLIDELYIYDRALTKEEVKWAYQHALDRDAGMDVPEDLLPPCEVDVEPRPREGKLNITTRLNQRRREINAAYRTGQFEGTAELIPAAGTKESTLTPASDGTGQGSITFSDLPAGDYEVKVSLRSATGKDLGSASGHFVSPGPAIWRGNKIGITDSPPPPYTPLRLAKHSGGTIPDIACWGRTYRFGPNGFPEQIISANAELLAGPITLVARSGGKSITWNCASSEVVSHNKVQAKLQGECAAEIGKLSWLLTAEFDGMLRYDLTLDPATDASVDLLEIRIPLRSETAKLIWHMWGSPLNFTGNQVNGALPAGEGVIYQHAFLPYFWLGDADRGLAAYCESDEAWQQVDTQGGMRIERHGDVVEAVWSFARGTWKLPQPWKFTFALTATPVKDTRNGRQWRATSHLPTEDIRPGRFVALWSSRKTMKFFGYPQAANPKTYQRLVKWYHDQGIIVTPYVTLLAFSMGSPEGQFYRSDWLNQIVDGNVEGTGDGLMTIRPTPDYIDFIVWKADQFVREMNLDGLYHDWSGVYPSTGKGVPVSGYDMAAQQYIKYERDGKQRYVFPFFSMRELYKRIYTLLKQHRKDAVMTGHISDNVFVSTLAFLDIALDGEQFTGGTQSKEYPELLLPLEMYQAEFQGHNLGCRSMFLDELSYRPDPAKHISFMIGISLLHDVVIWTTNYSQERVFKVMDGHGFTDAEFIPYWRSNELVRGQTESVKCSVYRKPKGGALLVICNLSKQPQRVTFDVDWEKLKSRGALEVVDALPVGFDQLVDWDIPINGTSMTLDINSIDQYPAYRLIRVR